MYGPRSLTYTWMLRPFVLLVTTTQLPRGRVRWAAVKSYWSNRSPLEVRLPWNPGPYQDAIPSWTLLGATGAGAATRGRRTGAQPAARSIPKPSSTTQPSRIAAPISKKARWGQYGLSRLFV